MFGISWIINNCSILTRSVVLLLHVIGKVFFFFLGILDIIFFIEIFLYSIQRNEPGVSALLRQVGGGGVQKLVV